MVSFPSYTATHGNCMTFKGVTVIIALLFVIPYRTHMSMNYCWVISIIIIQEKINVAFSPK